MELLHRRCAGLDVHKEEVVAAVRVVERGRLEQVTERFGTTTQELLRLGDWLEGWRVRDVVMEATGVYWKPVWHILEERFALVLANAGDVRNRPGRKSDVSDAAWLAELLAFGLVRGSFVPPEPIQQLRDLTRARTQLVRRIGQETLRLQKVLEDANIKIAGVVTDILGTSGRAILRGLIEGETDPERLLARTTGRLQAPRERLLAGLVGRVTAHHRFLLRFHLRQVESDERFLAEIEGQIARVLDPFRSHFERLITVPGVSTTVATILIGEIGVDMSRFPTDGHLISWAGLCPRMDESAGRRRSTRIRPGDPWLKTALVQAAWAAVRVKDSYLRSQFLRLRARRGPKKAIIAVAASILTAVYHMLSRDISYHDLGAAYLDTLDKARTARRLVRRLEDLGFSVHLTPAA